MNTLAKIAVTGLAALGALGVAAAVARSSPQVSEKAQGLEQALSQAVADLDASGELEDIDGVQLIGFRSLTHEEQAEVNEQLEREVADALGLDLDEEIERLYGEGDL